MAQATQKDVQIIAQVAVKEAATIYAALLTSGKAEDFVPATFNDIAITLFDQVFTILNQADQAVEIVQSTFPGTVTINDGSTNTSNPAAPQQSSTTSNSQFEQRPCPKCGGPTWDNRQGKKNPKAPDFRCKDKDSCDGVIWPDRNKAAA